MPLDALRSASTRMDTREGAAMGSWSDIVGILPTTGRRRSKISFERRTTRGGKQVLVKNEIVHLFLYSYESMDEHVIDVYYHIILWRVTKLMIFDS